MDAWTDDEVHHLDEALIHRLHHAEETYGFESVEAYELRRACIRLDRERHRRWTQNEVDS